MDFFQGIPSEIVDKIKMLRMDKDDGGQLKVSRFSEKIEKEISETFVARFIGKLLPLPSAAPSAIISNIWNAAGLSKQSLLIDKRLHGYFLTLLKESKKEKFLQRQPFIIISTCWLLMNGTIG